MMAAVHGTTSGESIHLTLAKRRLTEELTYTSGTCCRQSDSLLLFRRLQAPVAQPRSMLGLSAGRAGRIKDTRWRGCYQVLALINNAWGCATPTSQCRAARLWC